MLRTTASADDDEIRREVDRLYETARESLATVWPAVEAVAKALLKHGELNRDALDEAIGEIDIYVPVLAVQRAHGLLSASPVVAPPKNTTPKPTAKTPKKPAIRAGDEHAGCAAECLHLVMQHLNEIVPEHLARKVLASRIEHLSQLDVAEPVVLGTPQRSS